MSNARDIYGDEFVDGVEAIRRHRAFRTEEDAIRDLIERLFHAMFDALARRASDTDDLDLHRHLWRIHDSFVGAWAIEDMLPAYIRLVRAMRHHQANRRPA